jgi:phospholipase C
MGGLANIKHVVILMQENRSFDEYFGTLLGALGFSDPSYNFGNSSLPCRPFRNTTFSASGEVRPSLGHDWNAMHAYYTGQFSSASATTANMGYYAANDLPYHWVLANTFTVCDHYFMSVLAATMPNRLYLMSGCLQDPAQFLTSGWTPPPPGSNGIAQFGGAITGNPGDTPVNQGTNPYIDDPTQQFSTSSGEVMLSWQSYPVMLAAANVPGITWYLYDETNDDNYYTTEQPPSIINGWGSLNVLNTFENPNFGNLPAPAGGGLRNFLDDLNTGNLPTISWLIPPIGATEWENNPVSMGALYIAQRLDALLASGYWDSTVFIVIYDEAGGDFDHVAPQPPSASTVTNTVEGWVGGEPIGPGFRVPALIVSPWTVNPAKKPGWDVSAGQAIVNSQPMDHTAILQLLGLITGVQCTNIAPWRLSTFPWQTESDWDAIFDWANPVDAATVRTLIPTSDEVAIYQTNTLQRLAPYLASPGTNLKDVQILPTPTPAAPWPPVQQQCYFQQTSQTVWSLDNVEAAQQTSGGPPAFPFSLVLDGFEPNESAGLEVLFSSPTQPLPRIFNPRLFLSLTADNASDNSALGGIQVANVSVSPTPASSPQLNTSGASPAQRWTVSFDLVFNNPAQAFGNVTDEYSVELLLTATFSSNLDWSASMDISLVPGAEPFMLTGPTQYLATDLRAYMLLDGTISNPFGVAFNGDPNNYITQILGLLNSNDASVAAFAATFDQDPAVAADPGSAEAVVSQVSHFPTLNAGAFEYQIYNFAIARVTLQNLTTVVNNLQVFFRLFPAPSAGTYFTAYDSGAYPSEALAASPDLRVPLVGVSNGQLVTIPFFAAPRSSVSSTTNADTPNVQPTINPVAGGGPIHVYFGCYLDINQQSVTITYTDPTTGTAETIQLLAAAASVHQCLVAEISYEPLPIPPGAIPGQTTDLIAQRNLAVLGGTG